MSRTVRPQWITVGAASAASVIALGLVTAPPERYGSVIIRTEVAAVQLQAAVSTQVAALGIATATAISPAAATAAAAEPAGPNASATGSTDTLTAIATAAIALAATPLWYLAFPVTLPLSVAGGIFFANLSSIFAVAVGGTPNPFTLSLIGAALGVGLFAVGPLGLAFGTLSSLVSPAEALPASARRSADPAPAATSAAVGATTPDIAAPKPLAGPETPTMTTESAGSPKRPARNAVQRQGFSARPAAASATSTAADPAGARAGVGPVVADEPATPTRAARATSPGRDKGRAGAGIARSRGD